mgnify:CR=1 FL=1
MTRRPPKPAQQPLAHRRAAELACTPAQLALAWLLHKAPHIIPIPGTTSVNHLIEDLEAVDVKLDAELKELIDHTCNSIALKQF